MVPAVVLVSAAAVIWLGWRQDEQADCSARYNERSATSQQARSLAAEKDRQALEVLVRSLVDDQPGDTRKAIEDYLKTLDQTDRERRENPVPPPPADLCA